jgi:hypothetical protein
MVTSRCRSGDGNNTSLKFSLPMLDVLSVMPYKARVAEALNKGTWLTMYGVCADPDLASVVANIRLQ